MTHLFGARRALLAVLVSTLLLQAYGRANEWSRELLDTEEDELTTSAAGDASASATCPSIARYRNTKKGCVCRKGSGTFVFEWDRSSANPNARKYPTTFPTSCRYYQPGTSAKLSFPTETGRCFCFACPKVNGVKYQSPGTGFLNSLSSGCYPYRYFFARIRISGTSCAALTSNTVQYSSVRNAITTALKARFKQFSNTFSPVVNQFICADGPNGDTFLGFRLGYLGPSPDAQNQIISDLRSNVCQTTTICNAVSPLPVNPIGEANPLPLPAVPSPGPVPTPGSSPAPPTGPVPPVPPPRSPAPPGTTPPTSPAPVPPPSLGRVCAAVPLPTGAQCANLIATNSACQESNFLDPLDALNLPLIQPILGLLGVLPVGGLLDLGILNTITEQVCVGTLCPALALNNPSFALYAPSTLGLPVGGLRCKCYSNSLLSSGTCTRIPGDYDLYQYESGSTGGPGAPPPSGPLDPVTGLLPILPIGSLTSILANGGDCKETPVSIPPASLSLLGLNVISDLQSCINACNLVSGRTYASYSSVLGTNLLPTCKCFTAPQCTTSTCGLLGLNCLLSSYTIYKFNPASP